MTRAERRRQAKRETKKNDNIVDITSYNDESGIFGDVPLDVRVKLALEPCEELNGKSVLDLAMLIQSNEVVDFDDWLENTVATDFSDAFLEFA